MPAIRLISVVSAAYSFNNQQMEFIDYWIVRALAFVALAFVYGFWRGSGQR